MRSRKVNVTRGGGGSLFIHFRGLISGGLFGRTDANVKLSLMGRLIRVRGTAVSISDHLKRKDYFGIRFLGKGRRCSRRIRFVLSSTRTPMEVKRIISVTGTSLRSRALMATTNPRFRGSSSRRRPLTRSASGRLVLLIRSGRRLHRFLHDVFAPMCEIIRTTSKVRN